MGYPKNVSVTVSTVRWKLSDVAHYGLTEYACGATRGRDKTTRVDRVVVRCGVMVRVVSNVTRLTSNLTGMMSDG